MWNVFHEGAADGRRWNPDCETHLQSSSAQHAEVKRRNATNQAARRINSAFAPSEASRHFSAFLYYPSPCLPWR